jgi:hypothetical protein
MANLLIVEGENDKYFIETVITHLNLSKEIIVEDWHLSIDAEEILETDEICISAYECIGGTGNLKDTLNTLKNQIIKKEIRKIGIVFDQDKHTVDKRLTQINMIITEVFGQDSEQLKNVSQFINLEADEDNPFYLACYLMNLNGQGELEDVLKKLQQVIRLMQIVWQV